MRWVVRAFLLVVILGIGLVAAVFMLPGDRIAKLASDQITNLTGRTVTMSGDTRSEEHTSELQSPVPISYAVFCLKKKKHEKQTQSIITLQTPH